MQLLFALISAICIVNTFCQQLNVEDRPYFQRFIGPGQYWTIQKQLGNPDCGNNNGEIPGPPGPPGPPSTKGRTGATGATGPTGPRKNYQEDGSPPVRVTKQFYGGFGRGFGGGYGGYGGFGGVRYGGARYGGMYRVRPAVYRPFFFFRRPNQNNQNSNSPSSPASPASSSPSASPSGTPSSPPGGTPSSPPGGTPSSPPSGTPSG